MAKLNKPYRLSEAAQDSLLDRGISRAAASKNVSRARKEMLSPGLVENTEDAARISSELSEVNKNLRAARRPRRS